jgi:hypothetical protein
MRKLIGNFTLPTLGTAFAPFLRVTYNGTTIAVAAAADLEIGVLEERCVTLDTLASVIPRCDPCPRDAVASGAISAGAAVYADASGKYTATPNAYPRGTALTAAQGDGGIFTLAPDTYFPLSAGSVITSYIASKAVTTACIDDLAVTAGQIGASAVTTAKINAAAVTTACIAAANITTALIAAGNVTLPKMSFTGLKVLSAAGVASAGPITLTGAAVGDRLIAVFGAPTAGGALAAKIPGTDF